MDEKMLMNPHTGSVDSEENWKAGFESMTAEEWGSGTFEGSCLIEVVPDGEGGWKEAG